MHGYHIMFSLLLLCLNNRTSLSPSPLLFLLSLALLTTSYSLTYDPPTLYSSSSLLSIFIFSPTQLSPLSLLPSPFPHPSPFPYPFHYLTLPSPSPFPPSNLPLPLPHPSPSPFLHSSSHHPSLHPVGTV